jgi:RNA-directed DNA polymerase
LLSNVVLDELDRELARRGHRFARSADDAKVYVSSERAGLRVMASLTEFIERRLRLKVNQAKSAVARPEDRHFLGFCLRVDPQSATVEVLLSERTKHNAMERVRQLTPRNWGGTLVSCVTRINAWLRGWHGFFGIVSASEMQMMRKIDAHLRRRLRSILLRHWKRKRTIARRLIKLGVPRRSAWRQVYQGRRSWWALSHIGCGPRAQSSVLSRTRARGRGRDAPPRIPAHQRPRIAATGAMGMTSRSQTGRRRGS